LIKEHDEYGQLSLLLVRNANMSGSNLKETVRSAILHLQKTETVNTVTQRLVANKRDVRWERRLERQECNSDDEPMHACTDCSLLLCDGCCTHHQEHKRTKSHVLEMIAKLKQRRQTLFTQRRMCKKHNQELWL